MARRHPLPFKLCVHCRHRRATRPRGLCPTHYYQPAVRALYRAMTPQEGGLIGGLTPKRRTNTRAAA